MRTTRWIPFAMRLERRCLRPIPAQTWMLATLIAAAAGVLFVSGTVDALATGDAAVYARSIADRNLSETTVHIGYYVLGIALMPGIPLPPDRALNAINGLCGAVTVACVFLLSFVLTRRVPPALIAVAILCGNDLFMRETLFAEVYGPQLALCMTAMLLWVRGRALAAGLALAGAVLITPTAIFLLPAMIAARPGVWPSVARGPAGQANRRRSSPAQAATLLAACLVPWLAVAAWHFDDYVLGPRGMLKAAHAGLSLSAAALKEWHELLFGFLACLPMVGLACGALALSRRYRLFVAGVALAWAAGLVAGERYADVPLQLPLHALLCVVVAAGLDVIARMSAAPAGRRAWRLAGACVCAGVVLVLWLRGPAGDAYLHGALPVELVALAAVAAAGGLWLAAKSADRGRVRSALYVGLTACVALNLWQVIARGRDRGVDHAAFKAACLAYHDAASPDYVILSEWSRGILFEHYVFSDAYTPHWINMEWMRGEWGEETRVRAEARWRAVLDERRDVCLLRRYDEPMRELAAAGYEFSAFRMFISAAAGERP